MRRRRRRAILAGAAADRSPRPRTSASARACAPVRCFRAIRALHRAGAGGRRANLVRRLRAARPACGGAARPRRHACPCPATIASSASLPVTQGSKPDDIEAFTPGSGAIWAPLSLSQPVQRPHATGDLAGQCGRHHPPGLPLKAGAACTSGGDRGASCLGGRTAGSAAQSRHPAAVDGTTRRAMASFNLLRRRPIDMTKIKRRHRASTRLVQ